MRKRIAIKVKVDIKEIGMELQAKSERRKEVFRDALKDICNRDSVSISQAKITLRKELKWACIKREVQAYCNEAKRVQAY
jgi:hypothetical protein